ncbi:MAG: DUF1326 domain-containing protein [Halioglobus sp.]
MNNYVDWEIDALEVGNCNCAYGCPCQFNALPTHGSCCAVAGFRIDRGHFAEVTLDGLHWVGVLSWPGPIHLGGGSAQLIIDERADDAQRAAIETIASGGEAQEGSSFLQVFASTMEVMHPTLYGAIEFACDEEARTATMRVPGLVETHVEPIRNAVTGAEHRARIVLPQGMEFVSAEMASGSSRTHNDIVLELQDSHTHICRVHLNPHGVIRP